MIATTPNTNATAEFVSVGQLASDLQRSVKQIYAACDVLAIAPALRLNRVAYYGSTQVDILTDHFRNQGESR